MNKSEIVMLIPCWQRPRIVQDCYDNIKDFPCRRVWLLSNDDPHKDEIYEIVKADKVIEFPNRELGRKMNAGIRYIHENMTGWRYLMNWGSDDIGSIELFDLSKPYIDRNQLYFGINNVYMFDTHTGEAVFFENYNSGKPIGASRMIHRILVEKMLQGGINLYSNVAQSGLDGDSQKRMIHHADIKPLIIDVKEKPLLVDLKTSTNINPFPFFKDMPKVDTGKLTKKFGKLLSQYPRKPLVSIIIPFKSDRGWLKDAVKSAKLQRYKHIEIVKSQSLGTLAENFNAGVRKAKGEFICYLCDDDLLTPNSIEDRVKLFNYAEFDFVHGNAINCRPDGDELLFVPRMKEPTVGDMIIKNVLHGGTVMYRREVFENYGYFDEKLTNGEEYEFNLRLLAHGAKIGYVNSILYKYRYHNEQKSLFGDKEKRRRQLEKIKARYAKYK
jgi:glycosyltransferase involved in cell wall biosynthesis